MVNKDKINNHVITGYRNILLRDPDQCSLAHYTDEITSGRMTKKRFLELLQTSQEHVNIGIKERENNKRRMKICIVIPAALVDEKLHDITLRFLDSIDKYTVYPNYEVLIYDNNSDPKLTEKLVQETNDLNNKDKFKVKILTNYQFNLSQVYNMALKDSDAELFIMTNNDMEILNEDWLSNIVKWFRTILNLGICVPYHDFLGNPFNIKSSDIVKDHGDKSFAIYGITRKVINEIGGFDERFDLYHHDHDVYRTVVGKGYKVLWAYDSLVKHYGERTTINHPNVKRHDHSRSLHILNNKKY
jgi:GT2 family glycosyltransferase